MRWISVLVYLVFVVCADVVELTDDNFEQTINAEKPVFVMFYAPHYEALSVEYDKLAETVTKKNYPFIIAQMDATVHTKTASKYEVKGYPTFKLFIDGLTINYKKERKQEAMLDFLKEKTELLSQELRNVEEVKDRLEDTDRRCILVSDRPGDLRVFLKTARLIREFSFYHTSEKLGKEVFPEIIKPSMVLLKDFEEKKIIYTGPFEDEALQSFIRKNQFDIVIPFDDESAALVHVKREKAGILLIVGKEVDEELNKMFRELAKQKQSDKYLFLICTPDNEWGSRYFTLFGIEESHTPLIEILDYREKKNRYRHKGKLELDEVSKFIDDFEAGKIEKFFRSEPIPEQNTGPVYTLVADNFKQMVIDNDMDVFVMFYAPWSGDYTKVRSVLEEVGKALKRYKKVRIAEFDATKNEIDVVRINSFPTFYLFQAGKKETPKKYTEVRKKNELIRFLEDNCINILNTRKTEL